MTDMERFFSDSRKGIRFKKKRKVQAGEVFVLRDKRTRDKEEKRGS